MVSKDLILRSQCKGPVLYPPRMKKSMALYIVPYQIKVFNATFKTKTPTSGSHLVCSVGQQV